jgi:emilin
MIFSFCLSLIVLAAFDRDNRNRRFTVDTFLAMHGPSGPPGLTGPMGSPGPRGAVGAQGRNRFPSIHVQTSGNDYFPTLGMTGRSKEAVPVVAFIAHLQKMLSVESNRSETIVFENAQINEGNGYNPSTGIFTAVYRGIYKFSMTIMAQMDSIVRRNDVDAQE